MATLIRRVLTVLAGLVALMWISQRLLTREAPARLTSGARDPAGAPPTRTVTIRDVLEANIPVPTRSRVSFPKFSYRDAFPEASDEPEIVVTKFDQAPMLKDLSSMPGDWRSAYPDKLPPVEDRLPRNPAVVVGPDGVGQYGGTWRMCETSAWELTRKVGYESLARYDPSGRLQPGLAYKWEVSPDSRAFTFYLRKGHKWSDGQPFTAHDVAWVCNVNIGSPHWADPPDWMQATDGALLLYEDDVADWPGLCRRLLQEASATGASVGKQIKALGGERLWKGIEELAAGQANTDSAGWVADQLNEVFRGRTFYTPEAFAQVDLGAELRELQQIGASRLDRERLERLLFLMEREHTLESFRKDPSALDAMLLNRMNLLLFRSAYRGLVAPARRERVKVEAVPDETGDDTHILRFTFRKPNSIFLEQTGTFMFYRGLFDIPLHWVREIHPEGTRELTLTDFWNWDALLTKVVAESASEKDTPGKRLWNALEEPLRKRIQGRPPKQPLAEEFRREIVAAFNRVLARSGFYDPGAWKGLDLREPEDAAGDGLGWEQFSRDQAAMEEYRDWLVAEDLRKRCDEQGPSSLSAEETLRLNVAMFRLAFYQEVPKTDSDYKGYRSPRADPSVTRTRTIGLDLSAQRQPRKYAGWVQQMRDRENYDPDYNPHAPTLRAWRIISKKDAPYIVAVRNPYYYRVDAAGNQLPYIDAIRMDISSQKEIRVLKLKSGNVDFQTAEIGFDEFTILKRGERDGGDYEIRLWADDYCGEAMFAPLQARKEPVFLKLNEDPNFRHALSLALNRQEIIDVVYAGMGRPAQFSIPEGSPYYSRRMATVDIEYDPNRANRLLDAMGLQRRNADGTRLLWDGTALVLDLNVTATELPVSFLRLSCQYFQNVGVGAQMKMRTSAMINRLQEMGTGDIDVHKAGGSFFGPMLPGSFYPSNAAECGWWFNWARYMREGGRVGWPAPERIKVLERMWQKLVTSPTADAKMAAWRAITDRFAADLPQIGVLSPPGKVVYVRKGFKNVPRLALAGWIAHEPGNVCPECFYFEKR